MPRPSNSSVKLDMLEVFLLSGPISETFAKKNPVISRTFKMRGDQTVLLGGRSPNTPTPTDN